MSRPSTFSRVASRFWCTSTNSSSQKEGNSWSQEVSRTWNVLISCSTGLIFFHPSGNIYSVTNISQQVVKIFFSQARRLKPSEAKAAEGNDSQLDVVGQDIEGQSEEEQDMDGEADPSSGTT